MFLFAASRTLSELLLQNRIGRALPYQPLQKWTCVVDLSLENLATHDAPFLAWRWDEAVEALVVRRSCLEVFPILFLVCYSCVVVVAVFAPVKLQ